MFRADVAEIRLLPRHEGDDILRCQVGPGDADRDHAAGRADPRRSDADPRRRRAPGPVSSTSRRTRTPTRIGPADASATRSSRRSSASRRLIGTLLVSDPLSDLSTFEAEDLKLFETLANHTAIALENGQLEQSLEQLGRLKEELHHQALARRR